MLHITKTPKKVEQRESNTINAHTCSKPTLETLELIERPVQSQQQGHQSYVNGVILVSLFTLIRFHTLLKWFH